MRMRFSGWLLLWGVPGLAFAQGKRPQQRENCARAVIEGEVREGHSFERVFRPGMLFKLEAIRSGWIIRVLPTGTRRGLHDYAELATPPYQSVTPLAVSTDFSFRAQDAVGWNPRRFRYAGSSAAFARMEAEYGPATSGDAAASAELAKLVAQQPEAQFTLLDARLVPGANDQVPMAAAVASHFATTQHEVEQSERNEALGRVTWLRFRVALDVPGVSGAQEGVVLQPGNCAIPPSTQPTMRLKPAS